MIVASAAPDALAREVRLYVFRHAAETGRVPQPPQIAEALGHPRDVIHEVLQQLASGRVLILAPNSTNIWAANPFCAVPSGFRVEARGTRYWGICIWDALGVVAAVGADTASVRAPCGDCGELLSLDIADGDLARSEGLIHFAVPARHWWDNIGFT